MEPLQPWLATTPRIISYKLTQGKSQVCNSHRGAMDICLLDINAGEVEKHQVLETLPYGHPSLDKWAPSKLACPLDGFDTRSACVRPSRVKLQWPGACGDWRGTASGEVLSEDEVDAETSRHAKQQIWMTDWRSITSAYRFKDPRQQCTGIENGAWNDIVDDGWDYFVLQRIKRLQEAGVFTKVEHLTLQIRETDCPSEGADEFEKDERRLVRAIRKQDREQEKDWLRRVLAGRIPASMMTYGERRRGPRRISRGLPAVYETNEEYRTGRTTPVGGTERVSVLLRLLGLKLGCY